MVFMTRDFIFRMQGISLHVNYQCLFDKCEDDLCIILQLPTQYFSLYRVLNSPIAANKAVIHKRYL